MLSYIRRHAIALKETYNNKNLEVMGNPTQPTIALKKYLIIRIFNQTSEYDKMKAIHLRNEKNSIFVTYSNDLLEDYKYDHTERTLYLRGNESYIPGILIKTITAIKLCMTLFDFDVIIRSNISTVINHYRLEELLNSIHGDHIYGGPINFLECVDEFAGITTSIFNDIRGLRYISGTGIILSKNLCTYLVDNKELLNYNIIDDVSIGSLLVNTPINIESNFVLGPAFDKNVVFYRFRSDHIFGNREKDIKDIETQYAIIKSNRQI